MRQNIAPSARDATKPKQSSLAAIRPIVLGITKRYGVGNVRVFGSFSRGQERKNSDIDLLIDLPEGMTLLDLAGLKIDLEDALKRSVDVVPARAVKPILRNSIFSDARSL